MAQCNIEGTLKYIEDVYKQIPSGKEDREAKQVLKTLFEQINTNRATIQQAGSFAGSTRININKPFEVVDFTPTPAPAATPKAKNETKVKSRKFGEVTAYFYPKGAKELKGALAFTRYDENGDAFIVMREGITKDQVISYLRGEDGSETSVQKSVVNEFMRDVYGVDLIGELNKLNDAGIRRFIIKHELSHIRNADKADVYYANKEQTIATAFGKPNSENKYLADSAIRIETRANLEALELKLGELVTPDYAALAADDMVPIENSLNPLVEEDTPPWDVEPVVEETAEPLVNYKVTGNMTTNEGQTKAINNMIDWFKGNKSSTFMLQGRGGTGKTTVINVLLRELGIKPHEVMFATPTNKAKKVIAEANKNTAYANSEYNTVAQMLGIKPVMDSDGNQSFQEDLYAQKPDIPKILIVDEASMLHSDNYDALVSRAQEYGSKIIFMGDNAQLPPIGDKKAPVKSVVFEDNKDTTIALTQLMRQEKDSPIINMTSKLIRVVDKVEAFLGSKGSDQQAKQSLARIIFDGAKLGKFNPISNEGAVFTTENFEALLPSFLSDYRKSPKGTKYISFNNHSHSFTVQKTQMIRRALFGEKADQEAFIPGEPLMLNGPYQIDIQEEKPTFLDNGEEFTVKSSSVVSKRVDYKVGKKTIRTAEPIQVHEIVAVDAVTGAEYVFNKPVGNKESVKAFIENEKSNAIANGVKPGGAYMLMSVLAQDLSHGYIINSHRSQGSTYDNVYMDLGNIAGQPYAGANDIIKALYVAASRPRKKLVVVDNRGAASQITNPSKAASAEAKPEVFENVDNAEANDIINKIDKCKSKG